MARAGRGGLTLPGAISRATDFKQTQCPGSAETLARMFHKSHAVWAGVAEDGAVRRFWTVTELILAWFGLGNGGADAFAPSPAWVAGLVDVNALARHWMGYYGLSAANRVAATAKSSRNG